MLKREGSIYTDRMTSNSQGSTLVGLSKADPLPGSGAQEAGLESWWEEKRGRGQGARRRAEGR